MNANFLKKEIKSFGYAFAGILACAKKENHFRFHIFAAVVVITAGLFLKLTSAEWCIIILCIALVIAAEMFNSAIERLTDVASKERNPQAKVIKDIAAGAVLICSAAAAVIALIILSGKL